MSQKDEVYFVMGSYPSYGGFYGWGGTVLEALESAWKAGGYQNCDYVLLKIKGDFTVSNIDGAISHQEGGLRYVTPKNKPRKFPDDSRFKLVAKALEKLELKAA